MKADPKTEAAVLAVLSRLAEAYARRDPDGLVALFAADPDLVMYGTAADEKRAGRTEIRAQAERDWAQTESTSLFYRWTLVSAAGDVAWASSDITFGLQAGGQEMSLPGRLSSVLERAGSR